MMRLRVVALALLTACAGVTAAAQDPKPRESPPAKDDKKKQKKPAKVYTEEDLKKARESGTGNVNVLGPPDTGSAPPPLDLSDDRGEESDWRSRAAQARTAIREAEKRLADAKERLNAAMTDLSPTNLQDPNRQQTLEAERNKARQDIQIAETDLADARKALSDLEEEARVKRVPPGWLREN